MSPLSNNNNNLIAINTVNNDFSISSPSSQLFLNNNEKAEIEYNNTQIIPNDLTSFASSPTTSTSSRRSSFSSYSSSSTNKKQCNSAPAKPLSSSISYPTLKSAHDRIEWLEEQIKSRQESNESIIKSMSVKIEIFLKNKKTVNDPEQQQPLLHQRSNTKDNSTLKVVIGGSTIALVINKLNELNQLVNEYNKTPKLDDDTTSTIVPGIDYNNQQQQQYLNGEFFVSTQQMIEKWVSGVTELKKEEQKSTKQDVQNVDRLKNQRLVQAIQRLSRQHTLTKKQLRKTTRLEASHSITIEKLRLQVEEKNEIEELLDEIRTEMEDMMEELNGIKLQRERYHEKCKRYEADLKKSINNSTKDNTINLAALQSLLRESETMTSQLEQDYQEQLDTHANEISTLVTEKNQLKNRLLAAERSVAELSLLMEVQKKQQQRPSEMEQVLRQTVAKRDGEIAKIKLELEKNQRHTEQKKLHQEKQMAVELKTRLSEMEQYLKSFYKKESDTFQLRISRDMRNLTGQIVELEAELQGLERQHEQDEMKSMENKQQLKASQLNESKSKKDIEELQKKIGVLEQEVLFLYSKNLELAQHLGELDLE